LIDKLHLIARTEYLPLLEQMIELMHHKISVR